MSIAARLAVLSTYSGRASGRDKSFAIRASLRRSWELNPRVKPKPAFRFRARAHMFDLAR